MIRRKSASESHEQVLVVAHVRTFHPDVLIAAVPNGGDRDPRVGARLKREGVLPGYPDLTIDEARAAWHGLRVEMKRADGKGRESKAQVEVRRRLEAAGYRCLVCHGADAAIREIEAYLAFE